MMEKYGTYIVFQNTKTMEIKRVPIDDEEEMSKCANLNEWKELKEDPEDG